MFCFHHNSLYTVRPAYESCCTYLFFQKSVNSFGGEENERPSTLAPSCMRRKILPILLLLFTLVCDLASSSEAQAQSFEFALTQQIRRDTLIISYGLVRSTGSTSDIPGFSNLVVNFDTTVLDIDNAFFIERGNKIKISFRSKGHFKTNILLQFYD